MIVALESTGDREKLGALGRQVAMHVAAASPVALDAAGVDPATVARERAVLAEKNAGKAGKRDREDRPDRASRPSTRRFALLDQAYVHDPAKTVAQAIKGGRKDGRRADRHHRLRPLRAG